MKTKRQENDDDPKLENIVPLKNEKYKKKFQDCKQLKANMKKPLTKRHKKTMTIPNIPKLLKFHSRKKRIDSLHLERDYITVH